MSKLFFRLGTALLVAALVGGCSMQAPTVLIITPTHSATAVPAAATTSAPAVAQAISATFTPTLVPPTAAPLLPTATSVPPTANAAARTPTPLPPAATSVPATTILPPPPTNTPSSPAGSTVAPTYTYGAVIGPSYTPPTPVTPSPTFSPTPGGTATFTPTPGPSPTPLPTLQQNLMGIQIHGYLTDADWQSMLNRAKTLGVSWIKVQILWKQMEPARGQFNNIYQGEVLNLQRTHNQGFQTLIEVDTAPDWARPPGQHTYDGPPADPQDLANFLTTLVHDVKPEFVDALEIWNEPNLISEWDGEPLNGATYLKYFDAAYQAIRNEEKLVTPTFNIPHHITIVVAGAATGTPDSANTVNDRTWLKQMYAAGLAHYGSDVVVGIHPYGWGNAPEADCCSPGPNVSGWYNNRGFFFKDSLDDYHQTMAANNHNTQLWVTEFGWASYDGLHRSDGTSAAPPNDPSFGWINILNAQQQADYTIRAFNMVQHPPYSSFVGPMMLWNLNFGTIPQMIDQQRQEAGFSLLDYNGSPRPVFNALAAAPKSCPKGASGCPS